MSEHPCGALASPSCDLELLDDDGHLIVACMKHGLGLMTEVIEDGLPRLAGAYVPIDVNSMARLFDFT
jgi:hypothetical protein